MRETVAGIILLIIFIAICLFAGRRIYPSYNGKGDNDPCLQSGHPLWQDC